MLKVLALATLTALPLASPSAVQQEVTPKANVTQADLQRARLRLKQFDAQADRRRELQREQLEVASKLRRAKRRLEDQRKAMDEEVAQLESRLALARAKLNETDKPDDGWTVTHPRRQAYQRRVDEVHSLEAKAREIRTVRREDLNAAEDHIAELDWQVKTFDDAIQRSDERARLEGEVERFLAELGNTPATQTPDIRTEVPAIIHDSYRAARVAAAAAGKPMLVNFTAHTAINARKMEVTTFKDKEVAPHMEGFVEARLHGDTSNEALRADYALRAEALKGIEAIPVYVAVDPRSGKELGRFKGASMDPTPFAMFLATSKAAMGGPQPEATSEELWGRIFDLEDEVARLGANLKKVSGSNW